MIAVVLGAPSSTERFQTAQKLMDYGFQHYMLKQVAQKDQVLVESVPIKGYGKVNLIASEDLTILMRKDDARELTTEMDVPEIIESIQERQKVGDYVVKLNHEIVAKSPILVSGVVVQPDIAENVYRILHGWMWW